MSVRHHFQTSDTRSSLKMIYCSEVRIEFVLSLIYIPFGENSLYFVLQFITKYISIIGK